MSLLIPEEESIAREPASFARLMGAREYGVRRLLLHDRGLSAVYERDATVHAAMQMYIGGHLTWQGGLLWSYRALHAAFKDLSDLAVVPRTAPNYRRDCRRSACNRDGRSC